MVQCNILLDEKENEKVNEYCSKWKLSKIETIKKIIREFKDG